MLRGSRSSLCLPQTFICFKSFFYRRTLNALLFYHTRLDNFKKTWQLKINVREGFLYHNAVSRKSQKSLRRFTQNKFSSTNFNLHLLRSRNDSFQNLNNDAFQDESAVPPAEELQKDADSLDETAAYVEVSEESRKKIEAIENVIGDCVCCLCKVSSSTSVH